MVKDGSYQVEIPDASFFSPSQRVSTILGRTKGQNSLEVDLGKHEAASPDFLDKIRQKYAESERQRQVDIKRDKARKEYFE